MLSPGEAVREKALALLADPVTGLNPAFVNNCQYRNIPVPLPGNGMTVPFDFTPGSASLFRMAEDINWLEHNTEQQYPCVVAYVKSCEQRKERRPNGALFFGDVTVNLQFYLAWSPKELPPNDDFEAHLDALESSVLQVLNQATYKWNPVIYDNMLDFPVRSALTPANNSQLLRRGMTAQITALYFTPQF